MAMTLRLSPDEDRALDYLAQAQRISKQEAVKRAIISAAARTVADAEIHALAQQVLTEYPELKNRIRQVHNLPEL